MRSRLPLLGVALVLGALGVSAQDSDALIRQLSTRMAEPARTLQDSGFTMMDGVALLGSLRARTYEDKTMRLEAGRQYIVVGVCDDDCGDMDLIVSDAGGREITADREDDPMPIVAIVPERTGDYTFRVQMYECRVEPCAYFVQPFGRGVVQGGAQRPPSAGLLPGGGGAVAAPAGARSERGRLEAGDRTLPDGEYYDVYTVQGQAGRRLVIEVRSTEFDTYLFVRGPGGFSEDNDDFEGSTQRSRLEVTLPSNGEYLVTVTSYAAGETGAYTLTINAGVGAAPGGKGGA
jgi:hypothetical protein